MENMSWGAIASIALVAIIALSVIYNFVKERGSSGNGAGTPAPSPAADVPLSQASLDAMVMSRAAAHAYSQAGFQEYIADHTRDQLDEIPVYAVIQVITASMPSDTTRWKWMEHVAGAVIARGADKQMLDTADLFWDVNEKWLFSETAFADFCNDYLIANRNEWPAAVHEQIVLAGYTALASRDKGDGPESPDILRVVSDFMAGLDMVAEAYFGAEAGQVRARLQAEAERLAPGVRANMA